MATKVTIKELALDTIYPVGCLYLSTTDTNPGTIFGGTWVAFGAGRTLVGKAASGTFSTAGGTMGAETHTLSTSEIPAHAHNFRINIQHGDGVTTANESLTSGLQGGGRRRYSDVTDNAGGGGAHNNIQPSIVVYMWTRTA